MTVDELMSILKDQKPDAEVEIQMRGVAYSIVNVDGNSVSVWIVAEE